MTPERIAKLRTVLNRRQPDLTVVTDYVHKGRNLSAIIRNADAVGVQDLHCVIGDRDYRVFRGTAMGSHSWVTVHRYRDLLEPLVSLKSRGFQLVAAHFSADAVDYHDIDYTRPTALIMGAERAGVSHCGEQLADLHVTIPMVGMVASYNVAVAAGILLAEVRRQRALAGMYDSCRLDDRRYHQLFFEWGHPRVAEYCREKGLAYPALLEDGEIDDPSAWYAGVRKKAAEGEPT